MSGEQPTAIVVGGSLCGLACGIALARAGFSTLLIERHRVFVGGSGMGVDPGLLGLVVGEDAHSTLPTILGNRYSTSWKALRSWLYQRAQTQARLTLIEGEEVRTVGQDEASAHVDVESHRMSADVVIGADGYKSLVRAAIDPRRPDAAYAGYLLWRGLIEERALPPDTPLPGNRVSVHYVDRYRLVAYAVPGLDGSTASGRRQVSWAWYDPKRNDWLRDIGAIGGAGDVKVLHGVAPEAVTADMAADLCAKARALWPAPWGGIIAASIERGLMFGTPIAEYLPERLVRGRLAMLGDAAHVVSPTTGAGFITGLEDVLALARRLKEGSGSRPGADSLRSFE